MMRLTAILLISAVCAGAQAQPATSTEPTKQVYKSVMPDGKIIFGDKPVPGAKEAKPVVVQPSNIAVPGPTTPPPAPGAKTKPQVFEAANKEVKEAEENLKRAREKLEANRDPTPEEKIGTVRTGKGSTGGMRTSDAYDERIKALEQEVATAQKKFEEAQARLNNAR